MLLALGLLLISCLCFGFNMTDEMAKAMKDEVTEKLHQGTPNLLLTLGDTLKDSLLNPTPDRNHGQQTIDGLLNYYNNLNDVYQMMKSKDDIENRLGLKLYRMLLEAGGPPHIYVNYDIEDAMTKFEWNNKAVYTARKLIDETEVIWENMQTESEKPKDKQFD